MSNLYICEGAIIAEIHIQVLGRHPLLSKPLRAPLFQQDNAQPHSGRHNNVAL